MRQTMRWLPLLLFILACKANTPTETSSIKKVSITKLVHLQDPSLVNETESVISIDFTKEGLKLDAVLKEENLRSSFTNRDTTIWKDPCLEFFFDPGADGKMYYELQINAHPQIWDLQLISARSPINVPQNMLDWDIGADWKVSHLGTMNDASDIDKSWTIEVLIPWEKLPEGIPQLGDTWAYNVMRVDYDSKGLPSYWVAKSTGKEMIHYPKSWPTIRF